MIVVLDTNVVVAALVANGLCREVLQRSIRLRIVASSAPLLTELEETLHRKFTVTPAVKAFLTAYGRSLTLVEPTPLDTPVCRDLDDDVVLATAVAAAATVLVTGDQDLLTLQAFQDIPIMTPRAFVELLDRTVTS